MKKGFTLVELLAVIVILGVLSVLIVPKVINTLNDSEEKTNLTSANGLLKAAEYKFQDNEIKGISENITIDYTTGTNTGLLDFNGKKPEKGQVIIRTNGQISMFAKIGDTCYTKNYNSSEITITPYNEETCGQSTKIVSSGDGLYESTTEPGRLIYRGANPDNYINIKEDGTNNVLYRIISYELDGTIKVVRNERLESKGFDVDDISLDDTTQVPRNNNDNTYCNYYPYSGHYLGCNVWGNSSNTFYNGSTLGNTFNYKYYEDNTLTNSSYSGTVTADSSLNRYLNTVWIIDKEMSEYIDNHDFNVGGVYYDPLYTEGDKGLQKEKIEEKLYTWNGKIGLMNITDYVETSTNPECTSVFSNLRDNPNNNGNSEYDDWPCSNRTYNWLPKENSEWFLSPSTDENYRVWFVNWRGWFYKDCAMFDYGIRPAFYLKSSVKLGGTGTESDPYYIIN